ncbi:MAG: squalene--hopene cyclase, partial [Acidobacteria bacterium]|nr:squalene--hopene cyclase [Acidobacteriota bacterium]
MQTAPAQRRRRTEAVAGVERADAASAVARAADALFAQQSPDGFWCGELTADTTLESDYVLLQLWLHQPEGA